MSMVTIFFIGIECLATILNRKVEVSLNDQTTNNLRSAKERIFDYFNGDRDHWIHFFQSHLVKIESVTIVQALQLKC